MEERGIRAYLAELIGTFVLVMAITMIVSLAGPDGNFVLIGLVHIFALAMLIYTLGAVSGGHFNPAVTVALTAIRKICPKDAAIYIVFQLIGGTLGALFTKAVLLDEGEATNYGATTVSSIIDGAGAGLALEAIFTFLLVWAIVGVAVNPEGIKNFAGLVIGGTLGFCVMIDAPLTGAGFNPARSLGPAIASGEWADFWIYIVGPVAGALVSALLYNWLFIKNKT